VNRRQLLKLFSLGLFAYQFSWWEKILILFKSRPRGKYYYEWNYGRDFEYSPPDGFSPLVTFKKGDIIGVRLEANNKLTYYLNDKPV